MNILIIVDAQNDFITGSLGSQEAREKVPLIIDKIKTYSEGFLFIDSDGYECLMNSFDIYVTYDTHNGDDYLETMEGKYLPITHCDYYSGGDGWDLNSDIKDALDKYAVEGYEEVLKGTFGSTFLPELIKQNVNYDYRSNEVDYIELIGYDLDVCVISNALMLKAHFPEATICVDVGCCVATSPEAFEAAKIILKSCQIEVVDKAWIDKKEEEKNV